MADNHDLSAPNPGKKRRSFFALTIDGNELRVLGICLLLGAVFGLFWIGLIAAWEHHDEPNHFQYIRMLLDQGEVPQPGDENFKLNRQILKSMIWNGFFTRLGPEPDLPPPKAPTYLPGYSQYLEPPIYYYLASVGVAVLRGENITRQMFGARLVSYFLYLLTIISAWGMARELTNPRNPVRWMLPVSLVFLPGFVDIMTAVNNDSAAVVVVSFSLWSAVRLIRKGFNWFEFFWLLALVALGIFTKSTAMVGLLLFPIVIALSVLPGRLKWFIWALGAAVLMASPFLLFDKQDAAFFYRSTSMEEPLRVKNPNAVLGDWVLQLDGNYPDTPTWMTSIFQPVISQNVIDKKGETVTLGVWMWSDRKITARTPSLVTKNDEFVGTVELSTKPEFFTINAVIDAEAPRIWLSINPTEDEHGAVKVYYDGFVLAEGDRPQNVPPEYGDLDAALGVWGGMPFENLLRNGSIETAGLRITPKFDQLGSKLLPDQIRPSFILASLVDRKGAGFYYNIAITQIFLTFWGYFGWAHIPISFGIIYSIALFFTVLGITGALIHVFRSWKVLNWHILFLFLIAIVIVAAGALVRGVIFLSFGNMFFPVARYLMPVIIPIMFGLNSGWKLISDFIVTKFSKLSKREIPGLENSVNWKAFTFYCVIWIVFDGFAVASVLNYYQGYPILF